MKLNHVTDIEGLFKVIDSCKGKVELVSDDGIRINLRSKLSQYFSLANVFSDGMIDQLELVAYEPEDVKKLIDFTLGE